jgi:thymidine kinase
MPTGKLTIVHGPMFAGKTTTLLSIAKKLPDNSYLLFKPSIDTRYSNDECVTHAGERLPALVIDRNTPNLFAHLRSETHTVFIDELNFFDPTIIQPEIMKLLEKGIDVVGSGLLYDFLKQPFGATLPLSTIADEVITLTAMCDGCGGKADHSYRKVKRQDQIVVGASDAYGACCGDCWSLFQESIGVPSISKDQTILFT